MNSSANMEALAGAGVSVVFLILMFLCMILGLFLTILPFWKICTKAGFPGALSLLLLVPVANIIFPFYLAFAEWPALRDRGQ